MAKTTGLIFHCLMSLQPERCLLVYCILCNAFFRDLPESSFVFHSSLLQWKALIWWLHVMASFVWWKLSWANCPKRIVRIFFIVAIPWLQRSFSNSYWFVLLCNELNIADREGKCILQFLTMDGARGTIVFFIVTMLWLQMYFSNSFWFLLLCNRVNIADKEP